ncbi:MAG: hypothetical protein WBB32_11240 [Flavobacteriales bacterium]
MPTTTTPAAPRLSVAKIAEYVSATPARRKRIILDAKEPMTFIVNTYVNAKDTLVDYFMAENLNLEDILAAMERIKQARADTPNAQQNQRLCIEALERFVDAAADLDHLESFKRNKGPKSAKKLPVKGVDISVQPEVILRHAVKGKRTVGAVKLVFSKNNPLSNAQGECIAALLNAHLQDIKKADETVAVKHCLVVDVFAGQIYSPPKAFKRKMKDVEAACEEIAGRWEAL